MTSEPVSTQPSTPQQPETDSIPRVPWSVVGREFIKEWGYPDGSFMPEHVEILGPSGSGKTYFEATILGERVDRRDSSAVFVATKPADATIMKLGWPVVDTWDGVQKNKQCVYWPRTRKLGAEREEYLREKISDLLHRLWAPDANTVVAFDEVATVEDLGVDMRKLVKMYWREARSMGITLVAMKQRPQGVQRDMHSESTWVVAFKPKDEDDAKRYAEVLGGKRKWTSVLDALDREAHECVLANSRTTQAVITWVDVPLKPTTPRTPAGAYQGRQ